MKATRQNQAMMARRDRCTAPVKACINHKSTRYVAGQKAAEKRKAGARNTPGVPPRAPPGTPLKEPKVHGPTLSMLAERSVFLAEKEKLAAERKRVDEITHKSWSRPGWHAENMERGSGIVARDAMDPRTAAAVVSHAGSAWMEAA